MDYCGVIAFLLVLAAVCSNKADAACNESTWEVYRGVTALGATRYTAAVTIGQCLDHCEQTSNCVAVDIDVDVAPAQCWIHTDVTQLADDNIYDQDGTNLYKLTFRCPTAVKPTSCYNPLWKVFENQQSTGANQYTGAASLQECLDYCGQTSGCIAVDFNFGDSPRSCWPHFNRDDLLPDNIYDGDNVNQYQLVEKCSNSSGEVEYQYSSSSTSSSSTTTAPTSKSFNPGTCTNSIWSVTRNLVSQGASQYTPAITIQQCLDYCESQSNCVAVDVDVNAVPAGCWPHFNSADLQSSNTFSQSGSNQYRLVNKCPNYVKSPVCYNPQWSIFADQSSTGANQYTAAQSIQECLDYCGQTSGCVAVDINVGESPPTCWPHFNSDDLKSDNTYYQESVNQYILASICANTSAGLTSKATTTATTTHSGPCSKSSWKVVQNLAATGALLYMPAITIQQCLDYCESQPTCVAVDVDVNVVPAGCWPHFNSADLQTSNTYSQPGTNHYEITYRCPNATKTTGCYNPQWTVEVNQSSTGATQYTGAQSVQECLDYCGQTSGCVAVDVNLAVSPPSCWPHFSISDLGDSNTYTQEFVNQYVLVSKCANTSAGVTQRTQTTTQSGPCTKSSWTVIKNLVSVGASLYAPAITIQQCLDYCESQPSCVAVDINVNEVPAQCWPHFSSDDLRTDNTFTQYGSNEYRLTSRCQTATKPTTCYSPQWTVKVNQSSTGATQYTGAQSVQECLDYCGQTSGCVAADVNLAVSPPSCWPHFNSNDLMSYNVYPQPFVNQYVLVSKCATGASSSSTPTTTTSTTTQSGPCTKSTWSVRKNFVSLGASFYAPALTIQQCLDYCESQPTCVAVDVDVNVVPAGCWPHFNSADLQTSNTYSQPGTNHYEITYRCPNATKSSVCYNPYWEIHVNQSSVGSIQYTEATSVQECLDYCGKTTTCLAVDVNMADSPPSCWPHFDISYSQAGNVYAQDFVNQYILRSRCSNISAVVTSSTTTSTTTRPATCTKSSWTIQTDRSSQGASQYTPARTVQQCLDYCESQPSCVAVDIDVNVVPAGCWPHFNSADLQRVYSQIGTNHYTLDYRCPNATKATTCYNPEWAVYADQLSTGAAKYAGPTNLQECLDYCGQTSGCLAVDYNFKDSPPSCWPHLNQADLSPANVFTQSGVKQYVLLTRCGSTVAAPTTTQTTTVANTGPCTKSTWTILRNTVSQDATHYPEARTIQQCLDYCESQPRCVAVDINVNEVPAVCWVHLSSADLANRYGQSGINQYQLTYRCPNATKATSCYNPDWTVYEGQLSTGASKYAGAQSVQECLDYCGQTSGCLAVDVNLADSPPSCWPHFNINDLKPDNVFDQLSVNQYVLVSRCVNTSSATCTKSTWTMSRNLMNKGASLYPPAITIQQCLDFCESQPSCVAVDIDVNVVPAGCWPHFSSDDIKTSNTYRQPGTDHYQLDFRCPNYVKSAGCYNPEWAVYINQSSIGATQYTGAQSVQECLDYCGKNSNCVAVDVNLGVSPPTCWPYYNHSDILPENIYEQPNVNQYVLVSKCAANQTSVAVSPLYGPLAGGTKLVITSDVFNLSRVDTVYIGSIKIPVTTTDRTNRMLTVKTPGVSAVQTQPITLGVDNSIIMQTHEFFEYRANPVVSDITPRQQLTTGGTLVTVTGSNLNSVAAPEMTLTVVVTRSQITSTLPVKTESCSVPDGDKTGTSLVCWLPPLILPSDFEQQLQSDNNGVSGVNGRGVASMVASNGQDRIDAYLGMIFDDYGQYNDISVMKPDYKMQFYTPPTVHCQSGVIKYDKSKDSTITFQGLNMQRGCRPEDYSILIGYAVCHVTKVSDNSISCTPPPEPKVFNNSRCSDNSLPVQISVGFYKYNNCNTCIKYASQVNVPLIVGLVVGLAFPILIILIILAACLLTRYWCKKSGKSDTRSFRTGTPSAAEEPSEASVPASPEIDKRSDISSSGGDMFGQTYIGYPAGTVKSMGSSYSGM